MMVNIYFIYLVFKFIHTLKTKRLKNSKVFKLMVQILKSREGQFIDESSVIFTLQNSKYIFCLMKLTEELLVCGGFDGTIYVWSLKSREVVLTLDNVSLIYCMLRLTEAQFATSSLNEIKIWSLYSKQISLVLKGHELEILALIKLNEILMASGSNDKTIRIWNLALGKTIKILEGHEKPVKCLVKMPNNILLSRCKEDNIVFIWNFQEGKKLNEINFIIDVKCLLKRTDDEFICANKREISVGSVKSRNIIKSFINTYDIKCIVMITEDLLAGGCKDILILWSFNSGKAVKSFKYDNDFIHCSIKFSNGLFAFGNVSGKIVVFGDCINKKNLEYNFNSYKILCK